MNTSFLIEVIDFETPLFELSSQMVGKHLSILPQLLPCFAVIPLLRVVSPQTYAFFIFILQEPTGTVTNCSQFCMC